MIFLDVLLNGKPKVVNFYNIFHFPKLEYNHFSVSTIKKAGYFVLAKKRKESISDNRDNVTLEAIKMVINYLINIFASKKTFILASLHSMPYNNTS